MFAGIFNRDGQVPPDEDHDDEDHDASSDGFEKDDKETDDETHSGGPRKF